MLPFSRTKPSYSLTESQCWWCQAHSHNTILIVISGASRLQRKWITEGSPGELAQIVPADRGMNIPQIRVGPGLVQTASGEQEQRLSYILIIQGVSGRDKLKIIVEDSLDKAAVVMLHEALNGFSTVFSAAFLPRFIGTFFHQSIGAINSRAIKVVKFSENGRNGNLGTDIELIY